MRRKINMSRISGFHRGGIKLIQGNQEDSLEEVTLKVK